MPLAPASPPVALPAAAYHRLVALCPALELDVAAPGFRPAQGWVAAAELAAGGPVLDAWLDAAAVRIREQHGRTARPDVVASRALHNYLWAVCLMVSGPWYLQRRVPRIRPEDLWTDLATGTFVIRPGEFSCLPDDPAADRSGVRVLPHEDALRSELRAAVADHVRPLLAALAPRLRRGPRALWGMAVDDLISGIWHLGRALNQEQHAVQAASALLPGPLAPFPGGAAFRRLPTPAGHPSLTRTRLGCCLHYTIRPTETCGTCPRLCDEDRVRVVVGAQD